MKYFDSRKDPFWTIYNVGEYSVSPYRVVFKELTDFFQSAVLPTVEGKPAVADTKLRFIECDSADEAYFVAGLLNSAPAILYLYSTATWVQTADYQASDISRLKLPKFTKSDPAHEAVVKISRKCHKAAENEGIAAVTALEQELDQPVRQIWEISTNDMQAIRQSLMDLGFPASQPDVEEVED